MKNAIFILLVLLGITSVFGQENNKPDFTGDNFSLEGALAMFKKANSLEEFEKLLNQEDNNVNNLDLNNDGNIDYITVSDIQENDAHVIVLSTFLNKKERQDIATIGIEKTGTTEAMLQIEGDDKIFSVNTIVEPIDSKETIKSGKGGPSVPEITRTSITVNVWLWPCVRFIYAPGYRVWISPYHWGFYPNWWKPWKAHHHAVFYKKRAPHRVYYHRTSTHRVIVAKKVYTPKRHTSTLVIHNRKGTKVLHKSKNVKGKKANRRGRR